MLQKTYWMGNIQDKQIECIQKFRMLFCKHEFPTMQMVQCSPAFAISDGGMVSNTYGWALVINNFSIKAPGFAFTSADEVSEQIRRLLILRMNFFFSQSPEEVENYCYTKSSVGSKLVARKILPDFFSNESKNLYQEIEAIIPWFQKVLHLPRSTFDLLCKALAAYEKAHHVLPDDPALSYALLVFVIEALANGHPDYEATWDDVSGQQRELFDSLFEDERISTIDEEWIESLRNTLVNIIHPGATKRFTKFALDHISSDLFDASQTNAKSFLRRSRIKQGIQNAYILRSSFSHQLTPLTQLLISESHRAEEVEQNGQTYITLKGFFRLVRSILLNFIEQQETIEEKQDLEKHIEAWIHKSGSGSVLLSRPPAYTRMKDSNGQLNTIKAQYAKEWFEDILSIYQENYVECLHEQVSGGKADGDCFFGIASSGEYAGRMLFRFAPNPDYDWKTLKNQSLNLIPTTKKEKKGYLQAIALLCCHLEEMDGKETDWNEIITTRKFGDSIWGIERFAVDVIRNNVQDWSGEKAEQVINKHLKKTKFHLPSRVEIACMLQVAKLLQDEKSVEGRTKWLNIAYGDTASYPQIQNLIKSWLHSENEVIEVQVILTISKEDDSN